jgi:CarboxypepD_reg-like domain
MYNQISTYIMQKIFIVFSYCLFISLYCFSQNKITGKILDKKTGEPLEFVTLVINKTAKTSATDAQGNFHSIIPGDSCSVTVSTIGYRSTTTELKSQHTNIIYLEKGPVDLKEIIITPQPNISTFHNLSSIDLNMHPINHLRT